MRKLIIEVAGLTLWYYPVEKVVHHQMLRYPGREALETALQTGLEMLRAQNACKWLSDDRRGGALPKSHHDWGQNVWGPAAAAAGWKYWALCPPGDVLGSANMARLAETYGALGVTVRTFADPDAGMAWLAEQV